MPYDLTTTALVYTRNSVKTRATAVNTHITAVAQGPSPPIGILPNYV